MATEHTFQLYDLTVAVEAIHGNCTCNMVVGDCFHVNGGKLSLPEGKDFCLYALNSCMPLLMRPRVVSLPATVSCTNSEANSNSVTVWPSTS